MVNRNEFFEAVKPYADSPRDKPLAIVHAGLWPYLDSEEQRMTRDNIADVLRTYSPNGMWITPDIVLNLKEFMSNPIMRFRIRRLEKKTGRKFTFYDSPEDAERFLAEGGFRTEVIPSSNLVDSLTCVKKLGLDVEKVREKSKTYDIHKMKLS